MTFELGLGLGTTQVVVLTARPGRAIDLWVRVRVRVRVSVRNYSRSSSKG